MPTENSDGGSPTFHRLPRSKAQTVLNSIVHYFATFFAAPLMACTLLLVSSGWVFHLSRQSYWDGIFYGGGLILLLPVGAAYYLPRGNRPYFVLVFLVPAIAGFALVTADIVTAWSVGLRVLG